MNPKTTPLLFLSVFCVFATGLFAGPIADTIRPYVENNTVAGVVFLVADKEKILECDAAGFADIASAKPMRNDTLFWIASMTKPMTAACIMMLVDEGKISLDDPVAKYIPEFANRQKIVPYKSAAAVNEDGSPVLRQTPITIRHLLAHTAGLPNTDPKAVPYADLRDLAEAARSFAHLDLYFEPGTSFSYSSIDTNTLGPIIEIVSGMPYATFLQKRLLDPLGMTDTTFWPDGALLKRLATSYRGNPAKNILTPTKILHFYYPLSDRKRHATPSGGLFSTASDVVRFGQLLLNKGIHNGKRILGEASIAEMIRSQTPPGKTRYGLCISYGKDGQYGHGGMFYTQFSIWPKEKLVTVYMVQRAYHWGGPDGDNLMPALEKLALKTHSPQ